jgi:predicted nuclease of restriction endonuclease-like (RecB) superfamily
MKNELKLYSDLLNEIKTRVRQGQLRANLSANAEMLSAYWDIGKMIQERQKQEGWGKGVIPRLAIDLKNEFSEIKGFSVRNIQMMVQFYNEYKNFTPNTQPSVAQLEKQSNSNQAIIQLKEQIMQLPVAQLDFVDNKTQLIAFIGWAHHTILIQKIKDMNTRYWYMQQIIKQGWSRDTLIDMIKSKVHERAGNAVTNFEFTLPPLQSNLAKQMLKDPYIFDFTTLATEFTEIELELELVKHVEKFILELGAGFAFVGRQYKLEISEKDFYIDLLFYHLKMRCFVVIELKKGDFIPEYAGKINFYCSAVDDLLKQETDNNTIGLILCQGKDKLFAEYALRDIKKPIGISQYELTRSLPEYMKSSLPSIEDIEEELSGKLQTGTSAPFSPRGDTVVQESVSS